jgi:hypothetical protein
LLYEENLNPLNLRTEEKCSLESFLNHHLATVLNGDNIYGATVYTAVSVIFEYQLMQADISVYGFLNIENSTVVKNLIYNEQEFELFIILADLHIYFIIVRHTKHNVIQYGCLIFFSSATR